MSIQKGRMTAKYAKNAKFCSGMWALCFAFVTTDEHG